MNVRTAPRSALTDAAVRQAVQPPFKAKRCGYRIPFAAMVTCPCSSLAERFLGKEKVLGSTPSLGSTVIERAESVNPCPARCPVALGSVPGFRTCPRSSVG